MKSKKKYEVSKYTEHLLFVIFIPFMIEKRRYYIKKLLFVERVVSHIKY